jgi:uncharacterized delta-60 repeat protein
LHLPTSASVTGVAVQPDGGIVLVGGHVDSLQFLIVRLRADGNLDPTFSGDGRLLLPLSPNFSRAQVVSLQSDGKIVVAGDAWDDGQLSLAAVRLQTDGSLDTTFGGDGKVLLPLYTETLYPVDMALQSDGKMVFVTQAYGVTVFRVQADGSTDTTFNGDGKFYFGLGNTDSTPCAIAGQEDGKIVIAGFGYYTGYQFSGSKYDFFVARLVPHDTKLSISNARTFDEGSAAAPRSTTFTITRSDAYTHSVTVKYQTADGTAQAGRDYIARGGTLTFAPGETTKYVRVGFVGDEIAEPNETFFLDLKSPDGATLRDSRGIAYIGNDDGPQIFIDNASPVTEGNLAPDGAPNLTLQQFTVRLSGASTNIITVNWATANGTAGPADYGVASGRLTFPPGETSKTITVQIKGDTVVELNETYKVNLTRPTYAVIADSQGVAYIQNDDVPLPSVARSVGDEPSS